MRSFSRVVSPLCALALLSLLGLQTSSFAKNRTSTTHSEAEPRLRDASRDVLLQSTTSTHSSKLASTATDTFYLYGGPDEPTEGRFQNMNGAPDRQGWVGVDRTDVGPFWQISDFNAATLGGNGAGNLAAWCGRTAAQQSSWATPPGYSNNWTEALVFVRNVVEPDSAQTVDLDFFFHCDTEPGYDFFRVEFDSAGTWRTVYETSGSDKEAGGEFTAPGVRYSEVATRSIQYAGGDYGDDQQHEIRVRLAFESDAAGSDQDGLWPTDAGAVQIDDISISWSGGSYEEDFESGGFDTQSWYPVKRPFFGDFSKVWARFDDIDPCRSNPTPAMGFVDAGQVVNNAASAALIPGYPVQTDGETSPYWDYGVPGGWVINYSGGLGREAGVGFKLKIANDVWSPPIAWDLPGTDDDATAVAGVAFRFDLWAHLNLGDLLFYTWSIRSSADGGTTWSSWTDRRPYYPGELPRWLSRRYDVSDLVAADTVSHLQIRLGVYYYDYPTTYNTLSTPSPFFDNVAVLKYEMGGPRITAEPIHLAQGGFPPAGGLGVSTAAARDALDVPFDMALDIAPEEVGVAIDTGDSIVVDVESLIPGASLADARMRWVLDKNPLFEDALRAAPARSQDENVITGDPARWTGEVVGAHPTDSAGQPVETRWFFDLPDIDFLYPGDVLRYAIEATDTDGRVSTLPADVTGLLDGSSYPRRFTVRALPSLQNAEGTQPSTLIYQDFGHGPGENELFAALGQLGLVTGTDYDVYATLDPSAMESNGLGSTGGHGANAEQLAGYDTILYFSGDSKSFLLSDGSLRGNNDKSDDLGVLSAWHDLPGARNAAYFGDYLFYALTRESAAGDTFVQDVLGGDYVDSDVRNDIDEQTTPRVRPLNAAFGTEFIVYGGCPEINQFDEVRVLAGASRGHGFVDLTNAVYPLTAASVIHDRLESGDRKVDLSFPFSFGFVYGVADQPGNVNGTSVRTELLREIFDYFGVASGSGTPVATPAARDIKLRVHPNPFNPRVTLTLENLPPASEGTVRIYNLRGELVRTLHEGEFVAPTLRWDGSDDHGARVASGVYVVEARAADFVERRKIALLR